VPWAARLIPCGPSLLLDGSMVYIRHEQPVDHGNHTVSLASLLAMNSRLTLLIVLGLLLVLLLLSLAFWLLS
jgi:hypothetical protein